MLIYNITLKIEWTLQSAWLAWMKETYLPQVMSSGYFIKYQLVRLIETDEDEGPTYALQLYARSREDYNNYLHHFLPSHEAMSYEKWNSNLLSFSTLMEVIE